MDFKFLIVFNNHKQSFLSISFVFMHMCVCIFGNI